MDRINISAQVPCHQECLCVRYEAKGNSLILERIEDFLFFFRLPGDQDFFASGVTHDDTTGLGTGKSGRRHLPVEQGDGQAVCKHRAEFLHQVEREAGAAWSVAVQKAHGGV